MQNKQKIPSPLFSRIGALFLLLIFLSVPMIEGLHHHGSGIYDVKSTISKNIKKEISKKYFSTFAAKCKICDFMKHRSHHFYLQQPQALLLIAQPLQNKAWFFLLLSSSVFLLKCANKGPPAICC